ncbi:MAG: ABC transporter ATP-binding protein [Clostridia bacterium]|nr:ABC transporter ATP-binding protein [Clostridia bacterium]
MRGEFEVIRVENVEKRYQEVVALNGVSLTVPRGELFGLLGVNGAGKTTLVKILSGLARADKGNVQILGRTQEEAQNKIAISPQETSVALNLTVEENLRFFAQVYGLSKRETEETIARLSAEFSLDDVLTRKAKELSGGYQRRLSIAIALVSSPEVLFLDEPTLGLDVLARRELWSLIRRLKGETTVFMTTHYMEEAEALCDRVAIMKEGKVIAVGTPTQLKEKTGKNTLEEAFIFLVGGGA